MRIFISTAFQKKENTSYPIEKVIGSAEDLAAAVAYDHVGCRFGDGKNNRGSLIRSYRNNKCFKDADCIIMDCDNTSSDPTADLPESAWKSVEDVKKSFPGVEFYVVYSRNHMKEKNGLPPRPKFHIYFPLSTALTEFRAVEQLKEDVWRMFTSFDPNAIKVSQFIFGVQEPKVEHVAGEKCIDQWVKEENSLPEVIPEGERNSTLSIFAGQIITRYGDTERAHDAFLDAADRCQPPLEDHELDSIWKSAQSFYHSTVEKDPTYKDPAAYEFGSDNDAFTIEDLERLLRKEKIKTRLNDITGRAEITGVKAVRDNYAPNALMGHLRSIMKKKGINCSRADTADYLTNILCRNIHNPVEKMLKMTTWDGEDRISELIDIMGITEERETVLVKKWLHQTVAMALNDDTHPYAADGVLVLQGTQGSGKTMFCRKLAMHHDWFGEGACIDVNNKDSLIQATGHWIVELGELDSTLRKEQSSLKAFLSNRSDEIRLPYDKAAVMRPRRTSFCATVNPATFLIDDTGSRRLWVVKPNIDLDRLLKLDEPWMRQMWTQVYETLYKPNPQGFRLSREELGDLQVHNEAFAKPLPGEIEILDQLNFEVPDKHWSWTTATSLAQNVNLRYLSSVQIGRVLTKLAKLDPRIQSKELHHCKQYLLPPSREFKYHPGDDDRGAMAEDGTVPSWASPSDFQIPNCSGSSPTPAESSKDGEPAGAERNEAGAVDNGETKDSGAYDWRAELADLDEDIREMVEEMLS